MTPEDVPVAITAASLFPWLHASDRTGSTGAAIAWSQGNSEAAVIATGTSSGVMVGAPGFVS